MKNYYLGSIQDSRDYFRSLAEQATKNDPDWEGKQLPEEKSVIALLHDRWEKDQLALRDKRIGADAYVKILKNIAEGHQKLYESRNKLCSKEVKNMVLAYAKELESLIKDLREAF